MHEKLFDVYVNNKNVILLESIVTISFFSTRKSSKLYVEYFIQEQVTARVTQKRIIIKPHTFHDWYYVFFYHFSGSVSLGLNFRVVRLVYAKREIAPKDAKKKKKKNVPTVQYNDCRVLQRGDIDGLPFALPLQNFHFFFLTFCKFVFPFFLKRIRPSSGKTAVYKRVYVRDSKRTRNEMSRCYTRLNAWKLAVQALSWSAWKHYESTRDANEKPFVG